MIRSTQLQSKQTHCQHHSPQVPPNNSPPAYAPSAGPQSFNGFGAAQHGNALCDLSQGWQQFAGSSNPSQTRVAVIDDFNTAHGGQVASALQQNGADTLNFNIGQSGTSRSASIATSLQDIARRLDSGEKIDAVNLSQQDFAGDQNSQAIQQAISYIQSRHGVPVVVAAGNGGPNRVNRLASGASLVAANASRGSDVLDPNSSVGNIAQSADTSSIASALVAARAGQLRSQGLDLNSIVSNLQNQARFQGGALD